MQIFYGDETGPPARPGAELRSAAGDALGHELGVDRRGVLAHWRKLGSFRARHVALARGEHRELAGAPYAFSRIDAASGDRVVVAPNADRAG